MTGVVLVVADRKELSRLRRTGVADTASVIAAVEGGLFVSAVRTRSSAIGRTENNWKSVLALLRACVSTTFLRQGHGGPRARAPGSMGCVDGWVTVASEGRAGGARAE